MNPKCRWRKSAETTTQPTKEAGMHWDCASYCGPEAWGVKPLSVSILATKWCSHKWKQRICRNSNKYYCRVRNWHITGAELRISNQTRVEPFDLSGLTRLPKSTKYPMARSASFLFAWCFVFIPTRHDIRSSKTWLKLNQIWCCGACGKKQKNTTTICQPSEPEKTSRSPQQNVACILKCKSFATQYDDNMYVAVFRQCQCHDAPSFGPAWGTLFCAAFRSSSSIIRCPSFTEFTEGAMAGLWTLQSSNFSSL